MKLTKHLANSQIIKPLTKAGFKVKLVGSVKTKGYSLNDIDIVLELNRTNSEDTFTKFESKLESMGYEHYFTDEIENFGTVHNYRKNQIGLDVFINEVGWWF